jgi:hypothetical protein
VSAKHRTNSGTGLVTIRCCFRCFLVIIEKVERDKDIFMGSIKRFLVVSGISLPRLLQKKKGPQVAVTEEPLLTWKMQAQTMCIYD